MISWSLLCLNVQVLLKEFLYCYFSHQLLIDFCVFEQKVITESDFIWLIYLIGGKILMREFHLETYSQFSLDVLVKPNQRKIFHHKSKKNSFTSISSNYGAVMTKCKRFVWKNTSWFTATIDYPCIAFVIWQYFLLLNLLVNLRNFYHW